MLKRILATLTLVLASHSALAQSPVAADPVVEVRGLAPQLVVFAGSDANFRSLVTGLSQGTPVTLVTQTSDGFIQTVTFTPAGTLSAADIARTLEAARQQLIARGVATPTAEQIGTVLAGGPLPTPAGTVQVPQTIATVTPGGVAARSASAGTSTPRITTTSPTSNLSIDIRPGTAPSLGTGTPTAPTTTTGPNPVATTTPLPTGTGPNPVMTNPNPVFSGPNPVFTSTPPAASTTQNGSPSPAVQMQGRR